MENKACPKCKDQGHDKDDDHLYLMEDGVTWYCDKAHLHASGEPYRSTASEEIDDFLEELEPTKRVSKRITEPYRNILPETYDYYKMTGEFEGDTLKALVEAVHHSDTGEEVGEKVRILPKEFRMRGSIKGVPIQLRGQSVVPLAKRLLITEGGLDRMSAHQMLQKYKVACVSLPSGANIKSIIDNSKFIELYPEVYFCFDSDEAGQKLSRQVAKYYPYGHFVKLDRKDIQEYEGASDKFIKLFFDAERFTPHPVVKLKSVMDKILEEVKVGQPWPWPSLTDLTYGRRPGRVMYLGAGVKIGKSAFIDQLLAFDAKSEHKTAVAKFEQYLPESGKRIAGIIDGIPYHIPEHKYDKRKLMETVESIDPYLFFFDHISQGLDDIWGALKVWMKMVASEGVTTVILDPLTSISNHLDSAGDVDSFLRTVAQDLAALAADLNIFILVTCHLKATGNDKKSHEEGAKPVAKQFRGSRAMQEACHYFIYLRRHLTHSDETKRNTTECGVLLDRDFGKNGEFNIVYNKDNLSYLEREEDF